MSGPVAAGVDPGRWRRTDTVAYLSFALPGLVGTLLITLGGLGVGWLPLDTAVLDFDVVDTLRNTTPGTVLARIMIFLGVAVLLQTWLVLGADLLDGWHMRLRMQAAVLATWTLPLLVAPPVFSRDMYSYVAQGRLVLEGYDPYTSGVSALPGWFTEGVDPMWGESPAPYGPLWLVVSRTVADLMGGRIFLAVLVFRLLAVVGVALMMVFVPRLAAAHGIDPQRATWLAVLNPLIVMHFIAAGHNDALMVGILLAALSVGLRQRAVAAAVLIGVAATIKPIALLALPFVGIMRTPRDWTWPQRIRDWVIVTLAAAAVFGGLALATHLGTGWIGALSTPGEVKTWLSPMTALGMIAGGLGQVVGATATNDWSVTVFRALGTAITLMVLTWLALRPQGRSATRLTGLAFAATVLLGPVVQPWYLLWLLPLFVATGLTSLQLRLTILITAAFTVHAMVEGSSTVDALLELNDGLAIAFAVVLVALACLASPRERELLLHRGEPIDLLPADAAARMTAAARIIGPPATRTAARMSP